MRKLLICCSALFVIFLSSCSQENTEVDIEIKTYEIKTIISTAGYNMELGGVAAIFDYQRQEIYLKYDIDPRIYQLYEGLDANEESIYLISFYDIEDAEDYEEALQNDVDEERLFYREKNVVILTHSEEIVNLF